MKKALTFLIFICISIAFTNAQSNAKVSVTGAGSTVVCNNDVYEPNDELSKAIKINPTVTHFGLICAQDDVDWFWITIPAHTYSFKVMLTDCPRDYDLEIYDQDQNLVATSLERGVTNEFISLTNPAKGDYFIKVFGYKNDFDATATYALRYNVKTYTVYQSSSNSALRTSTAVSAPEISVYPNPAINYVKLNYSTLAEGTMDIKIYDHVGRIMSKISELHGEGINTHTLDVSYLPNGFYMIEVNVNNQKQLKKLTIDRK